METNYYNISLTLVKKHLNINLDFIEDDMLLMAYIEAAIIAVEHHIDYPLNNLIDDNGSLPMPLVQAILLLVGTWYSTRESVVFGQVYEVPNAYEYLLSLYKDYGRKYKDNECNCGM